jgi:ankyrin repeat protein
MDRREGKRAAGPGARRRKWALYCTIIAAVSVPAVYFGYVAYRLHKGGRHFYTELHLAVLDGNVGRVRELLDRGARVDPRATDGVTPLHLAAGGREEIVRLLLSHGADANAETSLGYRPLVYAVAEDSLPQVRLLIEKGAVVNFRFAWRNTPLHVAALRASPEVAEYLLQHGADVNAIDDQGRTPLDMAVSEERPEVADVLRRYGGKTAAAISAAGTPDAEGAGH